MKRLTMMGVVLLASVTLTMAGGLGVVDMDALVKAHPKSDVNRDILSDQMDELADQREAMLTTLQEKKEAFLDARRAAADPAVSDAVREEREERASGLLEELQDMEQEMSQRLMDRQREMNEQKLKMYRVVEEAVQKLVARVATKKDISLVVDKAAVSVSGASVVVFHEAKLDITDAVMKEIRALRDAD